MGLPLGDLGVGGGGMGLPLGDFMPAGGADASGADTSGADASGADAAGAGVSGGAAAAAAGAGSSSGSFAFLGAAGAFFFLAGSSGWTSRLRPSRSAFRRTRSAWASSMLEEWLFTPIPSAAHRSSVSLFVSPSSRASS